MVGAADPQVTFTSADAFLIPFRLLWGGFAIFWEVAASSSGAPIAFDLFGVPFVVIGLYLIGGRFVYKRYRKQRTLYALTDQRAMILVGGRSLTDGPVRYQPLNVRRSRDGRHASTVFGNGAGFRSGAAVYANTGLDLFNSFGAVPVAFSDVADVEPMLHAIERAMTG